MREPLHRILDGYEGAEVDYARDFSLYHVADFVFGELFLDLVRIAAALRKNQFFLVRIGVENLDFQLLAHELLQFFEDFLLIAVFGWQLLPRGRRFWE